MIELWSAVEEEPSGGQLGEVKGKQGEEHESDDGEE